MGSVHLRVGDAPAALIELRKAVELNPHAAGRQRPARPRPAPQRRARGGAARLPARARDQPRRLQRQPAGQRAEEARPAVRRGARSTSSARCGCVRTTSPARFALAGVHVSQGKNEEARQLLEAVVAAEPKYIGGVRAARARLLPAQSQGRRRSDAGPRPGAERRGPGAPARRPAAGRRRRRKAVACGGFATSARSARRRPRRRAPRPSANQPVTMSGLPSPSTSPRSSVAC